MNLHDKACFSSSTRKVLKPFVYTKLQQYMQYIEYTALADSRSHRTLLHTCLMRRAGLQWRAVFCAAMWNARGEE
jgi:hypothetical protein